jgi:branched-chain amino acid transport system permease protein
MTLALQLVISGVATGSIYALVAIGIVLIYKCSGVVNFAQGAYAMLGAYVTFILLGLHVPSVPAVILAMVVMAGFGALTERLVLRPMLKAPVVAVMMVTLGLLIFIRACCLVLGSGPDRVPAIVSGWRCSSGGYFRHL